MEFNRDQGINGADNLGMLRESPPALAPRLPLIWRDLAIITVVVVGFLATAVHFEVSERVAAFARRYEHVQADELTLTLLVLSVCLIWFALQRARAARSALTERIQAQARVAELLAHNRDLAQRLIVVQEDERRALARELHDEVGQNCTAIRAEASFIAHAQVGESVNASAQRIDRAAEQLYAMVQGMLKRLRPSALDTLGVVAALQELCESWETQTEIACAFFPRGVPSALDDATSIALFRLVQEALTNITRHAQATQVNIGLQLDAVAGQIQLTVLDDGIGMAQTDGPRTGFGLMGMRERVAALQGQITFERGRDARGVLITVALPSGAST